MARAVLVLGLALLGLCACPSRSQPQQEQAADKANPDPHAGARPITDIVPLVKVEGFAPRPSGVAESSVRFALEGGKRAWACEITPGSARWRGRCEPLPRFDKSRNVEMHDGAPGSPFVLEVAYAPMLLSAGRLESLGPSESKGRAYARASGEVHVVQKSESEAWRSPARMVSRQGETSHSYDLPVQFTPYWELQMRGELFFFVEGEVLRVGRVTGEVLEDQREVGPWLPGSRIHDRCRAGQRTVLMTSWVKPRFDAKTIRKVRLYVQDRAADAWTHLDAEVTQGRNTRQLGLFKSVASAPALSCTSDSIRLTARTNTGIGVTRCAARSCEYTEHALGSDEAPLSRQTIWLDDQLLVVWLTRDHKVLMRLGPVDQIAAVPETVLLDADRGPSSDAFSLVAAGEDALVLARWGGQFFALWIAADGSFGPVAVD